jgi:hypothetical protein
VTRHSSLPCGDGSASRVTRVPPQPIVGSASGVGSGGKESRSPARTRAARARRPPRRSDRSRRADERDAARQRVGRQHASQSWHRRLGGGGIGAESKALEGPRRDGRRRSVRCHSVGCAESAKSHQEPRRSALDPPRTNSIE